MRAFLTLLCLTLPWISQSQGSSHDLSPFSKENEKYKKWSAARSKNIPIKQPDFNSIPSGATGSSSSSGTPAAAVVSIPPAVKAPVNANPVIPVPQPAAAPKPAPQSLPSSSIAIPQGENPLLAIAKTAPNDRLSAMGDILPPSSTSVPVQPSSILINAPVDLEPSKTTNEPEAPHGSGPSPLMVSGVSIPPLNMEKVLPREEKAFDLTQKQDIHDVVDLIWDIAMGGKEDARTLRSMLNQLRQESREEISVLRQKLRSIEKDHQQRIEAQNIRHQDTLLKALKIVTDGFNMDLEPRKQEILRLQGSLEEIQEQQTKDREIIRILSLECKEKTDRIQILEQREQEFIDREALLLEKNRTLNEALKNLQKGNQEVLENLIFIKRSFGITDGGQDDEA